MIQFLWASIGFCNEHDEASELRLQNIVITKLVLLKLNHVNRMHIC